MRYTTLGRSGPAISSMGLGSLALAGAYGRVSKGEALRIIRRALDAGVTLVDTADFYADGQVERLVGQAVAGHGDDVVVCTRGGVRGGGGRHRPVEYDATPGYLERACDASLERLGTDRVDVYYLHCQDERVPIEASVGKLAELVEAGKIGYLGLSGCTARQLLRAHAVHPITALAVEYSLWGRHASGELLAAARRLGVGLVAARPLGRGFLSGRIKADCHLGPADWRRDDPRFLPAAQPPHLRALKEVEAVAAQLDLGAGRLALGWLLAQGEPVIPVPSTRDQVHLEMNLAAATVALAPEIRDRLAGLFPDQSPSPLL